jgi:predicted translin family RNA/ssDNA-binding protein
MDSLVLDLLRLSLQFKVLNIHLQLADLTGELMRLAIGRISDGELEFAEKICSFARDIYRELTLVVPHMDDSSDMKTKMDTMLQSVMKIENGNVFAFKSEPYNFCSKS